MVSYALTADSQGRPRADDVRFIVAARGASPMRRITRPGIAVPVAFAAGFLVALGALAAAGRLEMSWLALYFWASVVTFRAYARDKTLARNGGWRIPEMTLHMMSLVGGWPGALIAQVLLRHKTRKPSFLIGYWFTVTVNCIALGVIVVKGVWPVGILLGAAV